ncbi:MAG TPA: bifunctional precorrin-2 dehydrogenase/sirohydrochlorin ferrochelatase [Acidimicrobiales bacterium]|nr:bifunctional precorrin-2 dehydrogenase/sirohydrochlorin ferrochelatase [Acidimicrobiales bacterium]
MPVDVALYPVNLLVAGRRCLVVGGGPVAARKAEGLLACGAVVHVVATRVGAGVRALPGVTWDERPYRAGDLAGCRLVVTATGIPDVDGAVFEEGERTGIWVNSADDPANCSFTLPAVVRRGPVVLTVSTGGHSPALAVWLKERLGAQVGPEYEVLADLLSEERDAVRAQGRSTEGMDWRRALDSDMLDLIRSGRVQQAKERLQACLSSS